MRTAKSLKANEFVQKEETEKIEKGIMESSKFCNKNNNYIILVFELSDDSEDEILEPCVYIYYFGNNCRNWCIVNRKQVFYFRRYY